MVTAPSRDPQDEADSIKFNGVPAVPLFEEDDFRFVQSRQIGASTTRLVDAMHSADELLAGVSDANADVRRKAVPRLVARWYSDQRVEPTLIQLAVEDSDPLVRDAATMAFLDFAPSEAILSALGIAQQDSDEDVRWSANYVLGQIH